MPPTFHMLRALLPVAAGLLTLRPRSARADARAVLKASGLQVSVSGGQHIPAAGPFLLVCNHYSRPALDVWWGSMALTAALPVDPHWIITAAWTGSALAPLSRWALRRAAQMYGFTAMPPMPPDPRDAPARAAAVRKVIEYARSTPEAVVALAPEGRDFPGGVPGSPPPGAGRFMLHLAGILGPVLPAGIYERDDQLRVNFGPTFTLELPAGLASPEQDRLASRMVMERITEAINRGDG